MGGGDALDKVRLNEGEQLYMEIEDYDAFEYLSPHLDGLDISLNELNDLAALLSVLDEVQEVAFEGLFSIEVQRKVNANGGVITLQDLRIWRSAQKQTAIMWWMPRMTPSLAASTRKMTFPELDGHIQRGIRDAGPSPALEE